MYYLRELLKLINLLSGSSQADDVRKFSNKINVIHRKLFAGVWHRAGP